MSGDEHPPVIPSWDCGACGEPWPCDHAREQLAAEMRGTDLVLYMAVTMVHAARDNTTIPPSELFERFLAWARSHSVSS